MLTRVVCVLQPSLPGGGGAASCTVCLNALLVEAGCNLAAPSTDLQLDIVVSDAFFLNLTSNSEFPTSPSRTQVCMHAWTTDHDHRDVNVLAACV